MTIERPPSRLPGVRYGATPRLADTRGSFQEVWRASWLGDVPPADAGAGPTDAPAFVQANRSMSAQGVLRGLHLHRRQLDYWFVASGRGFVALVDVRPMLAGGSAPTVETRELPAGDWVVIPTGVAHGFLALEALELLYLVTSPYDGSDEFGFAWDDPTAGIAWPAVEATPGGRPILSERDQSNPTLAELIGRLRDEGS